MFEGDDLGLSGNEVADGLAPAFAQLFFCDPEVEVRFFEDLVDPIVRLRAIEGGGHGLSLIHI